VAHFVAVEPDGASGKAAGLLTQVQKTLGSTPHERNDWLVVSL
jgi:hypothetical protein